jgi:hypothetical protein
VEFEVFNPGQGDVGLQFNVKHKRTTSYQTRVEHPFKVKPGRNSVKIGLDEMANVNGSAPDLSDAQRWYINPTDGKAPTLYFSDVFLVGDDVATPPAAAPAASGGPVVSGFSGSYRVTGKVGDMNVDLNVQPVGGAVQAVPGMASGTGPAAATSGPTAHE